MNPPKKKKKKTTPVVWDQKGNHNIIKYERIQTTQLTFQVAPQLLQYINIWCFFLSQHGTKWASQKQKLMINEQLTWWLGHALGHILFLLPTTKKILLPIRQHMLLLIPMCKTNKIPQHITHFSLLSLPSCSFLLCITTTINCYNKLCMTS